MSQSGTKAGLGFSAAEDEPDEQPVDPDTLRKLAAIETVTSHLRQELCELQEAMPSQTAAFEQLSGQVRQIEAALAEYRTAIITLSQRIDAVARAHQQIHWRAAALDAVAKMRQPGDSRTMLQQLVEWCYDYLTQDVPKPEANSTPVAMTDTVN